ncbi:MAG: hypothetical protein ISN29_02495 [Gammaproteobacteria bacterium AqS3]|nr:hypothetical protein [Gammaproteobacteria bacterium AqS3]
MHKPNWNDVDESVGEFADALNAILDNNNVIADYLSNLDASNLKKADAENWDKAYHLCQVVGASHYALCELSVNLFNTLQKAKGRAVGW